jgi:sec-independent protein translocase protein TatC
MREAESSSEVQTFLGHLEDLRLVLLKSAAAIIIGMIGCLIFTQELLLLLQQPLVVAGQDPGKMLKVLGIVDPFAIQMQVSFVGGLIVSLPLVLFFAGQFLLPALTRAEARLLIPVFAAGSLLFLSGVLFCYFLLLPQTLRFFNDYNTYLNFQTEWTIQNYLDFVVQMLVAFGLCFELPLVILVLNYLGIVSHQSLKKYRRHAIIVIVMVAACITPTSDPFSLSMLAVPMGLLYEACVWITWWRERGRSSRQNAYSADPLSYGFNRNRKNSES